MGLHVRAHTHSPPPPKEAGAQTAPVRTGPSFLQDPITQGCVLASCVPAIADWQCDFGPGPPSPGLLVPFVLQGLSPGPLRALVSAAGSVVVRISGFSIRWPRFKCGLCLSRCVSSDLLLNLHPCAHLEHGLMTVMMLVMTVMMLLMKVVTPWMEVMMLVVRVMAWR